MTDRKLRVFLCHASQDKPVVRELYQRLLAEGWIDPWLDEEKLLPGQDWDMEIEKAVEFADVVLVCLSNNSVTKDGYIQKELKYVLNMALEKVEGNIFTIPLRFDNCQIPRRLRSVQYIDYFPSEQREISFSRILDSLEKCARDNGFVAEKQNKSNIGASYILSLDKRNLKGSEIENNMSVPSRISGLSGASLGLLCFFLPWVLASCNGGETYTRYTGYELSLDIYYIGPYSPAFLIIPTICLLVLILFIFKRLSMKIRMRSSYFVFDCGIVMMVTLLAHLPWVAYLIREEGILLKPDIGLYGTGISIFLITLSGVYDIAIDKNISRDARYSFYQQRLVVYIVLLLLSSFLIYVADDLANLLTF